MNRCLPRNCFPFTIHNNKKMAYLEILPENIGLRPHPQLEEMK